MAYRIKCFYETGSSFGRWDEETTLELVNNDLAVAKDNLSRIAEHYKAHQAIENHSWHEERRKWTEFKDERWYSDTYPQFTVILKTDNGNDLKLSVTEWCGYFERLHSAELVCDDLKIEF